MEEPTVDDAKPDTGGEPMETEPSTEQSNLQESVETAGSEETEKETKEELDLKKMSEEYAQYLVVNSKQDTQLLDDCIETVVVRVEEFKQQLDVMHQNITSSSNKMQQLHEKTQQLTELFQRIDQIEAFVNVVGRNVDHLEESISRAERELDPSKLRKVFSSLPGLRRSTSKPGTPSNWQPPKVFKTREYFPSTPTPPSGSPMPPTQPTGQQPSSSSTATAGRTEPASTT